MDDYDSDRHVAEMVPFYERDDDDDFSGGHKFSRQRVPTLDRDYIFSKPLERQDAYTRNVFKFAKRLKTKEEREDGFHTVKGTGGMRRKIKKNSNKNRDPSRGRRRLREDRGKIVSRRSTRNPISNMIAPVSFGTRMKTRPPKVNSDGRGAKLVQHTELIAVIAGSTAYAAAGTPLNPGLITTFPWLGLESLTYEMYEWISLRFIYIPSCATTTTGVVGMCIDFDSADALPTTETEFSSSMDAVTFSPFERGMYVTDTINFRRQFPNKFVRYGGTELLTNDIKTFDLGQFQFFTSGQANTNVIGRIYAEYSVRFTIPFLSTVTQKSLYNYNVWLTAGVSTNAPFGTTVGGLYNPSATVVPSGFSGDLVVYCDYGVNPRYLTVLGIPIGAVVMFIYRIVASALTGTPLFSAVSGCVAAVGNFDYNTAVAASTGSLCVNHFVATTNGKLTVTFTGMTTVTTPTNVKTQVTAYGSEILPIVVI